MPIYICLLRGINVSGQKPLKMTELTEMFQRMGCTKVQTYIQSGNVVFESDRYDESQWCQLIKTEIEKTFTYTIPVWVVSVEKWQKIMDQNPYKDQANALETCYISIFDSIPADERVSAVHQFIALPDTVSIIGDVGYVWAANKYGNTKLSNNFLENKLKVASTTRNLKTMYKLSEMAGKMA